MSLHYLRAMGDSIQNVPIAESKCIQQHYQQLKSFEEKTIILWSADIILRLCNCVIFISFTQFFFLYSLQARSSFQLVRLYNWGEIFVSRLQTWTENPNKNMQKQKKTKYWPNNAQIEMVDKLYGSDLLIFVQTIYDR